MKRLSRRMNQEDWAWLMASTLFGLFFATLAILSDISDSGPRHITTFNDTTGKWEDSVKPAYRKRFTVQTNGDTQKMIYAVEDVDRDSYVLPSANHPKMTVSDYFLDIFACVFGMMMLSCLFRIVMKICHRILGGPPPTDEIARDPSTSSG